MSRNGIIYFFLLLILASPSYSYESDVDLLAKAEVQHFIRGTDLYNTGDFNAAIKFFNKINGKDFFLYDYVQLMSAVIYAEQGKKTKALHSLVQQKQQFGPVCYALAGALQGKLNFNKNKNENAFDSYSTYFKSPYSNNFEKSDLKRFFISAIAINNSSLGDALDSFYKSNSKAQLILAEASSNPIASELMNISNKDLLYKIFTPAEDYSFNYFLPNERNVWEKPTDEYLNKMLQTSYRSKAYTESIHILNEKLESVTDLTRKAKIEFDIGYSYLNLGREHLALKYFKKSLLHSKNRLLEIKSHYYVGRVYEFLKNYKKAARSYRKVKKYNYRTDEELRLIVKSIFRAGWVNFKAKNYKTAAQDFSYICKRFGYLLTQEGYPYWLGITELKLNNINSALQHFQTFYRYYPVSYYGILSAIEIHKATKSEPPLQTFSKNQITGEISAKNRHIMNRALILYLAGLKDFAIYESTQFKINFRNEMDVFLTANLFLILENFKKSIYLLDYLIMKKRGLPSISILKLFYPLKYYELIREYSEIESIDPYLVSALIRQESIFQEDVVSRANAVGLMQIIPSLGQRIAAQIGISDFTTQHLTNPSVNLQIGIKHLKELLNATDGNIFLSIASYNSSLDKVLSWEKLIQSENVFQFIEDIPYYETRKYVKMIIRNYANYLKIYSNKNWLTIFEKHDPTIRQTDAPPQTEVELN